MTIPDADELFNQIKLKLESLTEDFVFDHINTYDLEWFEQAVGDLIDPYDGIVVECWVDEKTHELARLLKFLLCM